MDNLEFELCSASGIKYDTEYSIVDAQKQDVDEKSMIEFSAKLMDFFKKSSRSHNKSNPENKVTTRQIKDVYIESINDYNKDYLFKKNQWAIAKILLYLRIKNGEKVNSTYANIDFGNEIDISAEWVPSEKDLEGAAAIIKEKELDYEFENIDNLYLEDYKPLDLTWE